MKHWIATNQPSHLDDVRIRDLLELVVGSAGVGVWDWHVQTGEIVLNDLWGRMLGYKLEELDPIHIETWFNLLHPDDLVTAQRMLAACWQGETDLFRCETRLRHKDGHWVWVQDTGKVVEWDARGRPLRMVGTHVDVSHQKETDQRLKDAANLLSNVLNAATEVSIIATDPDGIISIFNKGAERMLGYKAEEVVGRHSTATIHLAIEVEQRGEELSRDYATLIEGFRVFVHLPELYGSETREWTYVRKDGSHFPVSLVVTTMHNEDGQIIGYLGIAENITARKQAEESLRESEARLRGLFELSPVGIALNDMETGDFVEINDALIAPSGYSKDEFVHLSYWDITPREYEAQEAIQLESLRTHGYYGPYEKEYTRKDGSRYPVLLRGMRIYDARGRAYIWSIVEDITERKRVDRMKNEFISVVSHELRTPLTAISGSLGLMLGGALGPVNEGMANMLKIAQSNSQRLGYLINDLLDMEKLVAGKMQFDMQVQPFAPLLGHAVEANRDYGTLRQVELELVEPVPEVLIRVDSIRFQQVLSNLLSNAIKFSPEKGKVSVSAQVKSGFVRVTVTDQGAGIPAKFRKRIFQKFSQADSSDSREKGGTGLGLAITKELVQRMDGKIDFASEEGKGASFWFCLPVMRSPVKKQPAEHSG